MRPFFFGSSQTRLFGVYHAPPPGVSRRGAIVLCQPPGPEYLQVHRAFRELADRLARAAFHVIRFDYYGCGDSAGTGEEGDLERWMQDLAAAIEEVREISGAARVCLVGLRLGATLAALVASQRSDIQKLVLWDPVVDGGLYLSELVEQHRVWLEERPRLKDPNANGPSRELLGTPLSPKLWGEIEAIDLLGLSRSPAREVLVLASDGSTRLLSLRDRLGDLTWCDYQHLPESRIWRKQGLDQPVVPLGTLQGVSGWLCQDHS